MSAKWIVDVVVYVLLQNAVSGLSVAVIWVSSSHVKRKEDEERQRDRAGTRDADKRYAAHPDLRDLCLLS